jgi:hypothetical protein
VSVDENNSVNYPKKIKIFCVGVAPHFQMDRARVAEWMKGKSDITVITGSDHGT